MRAVLPLLLFAAFLPQVALASEPTGEWVVASKKAHIRIVDCAGTLWGVVSWQQSAGVDDKNPDPAKRGRPTFGMPVLMDLKASGPNNWNGALYNSNNGKTYTGGITVVAPDRVRVRGCILGFLCGGEDWTRVDEADNDALSSTATAICKAMDKPGS
jgi:uncharacterized protein (DUF2147 family)